MTDTPRSPNPSPADALEPCPWPHEGTDLLHGSWPAKGQYWVHCPCGAMGPHAASPEKAIAAWNRRAAPSAAPNAPSVTQFTAPPNALAVPQHNPDCALHNGWPCDCGFPQTDAGNVETYRRQLRATAPQQRPAVDESSEREAFEKWAKDDGYYMDPHPHTTGSYEDTETACAWYAWLARARLAGQVDGGEG